MNNEAQAHDPVPAEVGTKSSSTDVGNGSTPPLLDTLVSTAHEAVDRVAAKAAPAVQRLVSGAHDATDAVKQRARDAGELGHEWTDSLRATVRDHPLASLAVAVAVGVLVSRLTHSDGR